MSRWEVILGFVAGPIWFGVIAVNVVMASGRPKLTAAITVVLALSALLVVAVQSRRVGAILERRPWSHIYAYVFLSACASALYYAVTGQ